MDIKNTNHRSTDANIEPCIMLTPIERFNKKSLVTLEQATEPLISIVPDIQKKVAKAKRHATNCADDLSVDESAAIRLYTMQWHPYTNSLYYILNTKLRTADREHLKVWFLYLKLLFTALSRLPTIKLTVYRGVILPDYEKYQYKKSLIWWGFSSCSANRNLVENKHFFGENNHKTLFIIDCIKGKDISKHSYFPEEKEILLLPATTLQVIQLNYRLNDIYIIHLKEIESPYQVLESVSIDSEKQTQETSSKLNNTQSSKPYLNPKLTAEIAPFKDHLHACLFRKRFTDHDIQSIVQEVIHIKQRRVLILRGTEVTPRDTLSNIGAETLAKSLSMKTNLDLKRLCLNHNGITDKGAEYLATMLRINKSLTHLWLSLNHISNRGIQVLAEALIDNKTLRLFSLEWNTFKNHEIVNALVKMTGRNQTLIQVIIDGQKLSRYNIKILKNTAKAKRDFQLKIR